MHEEEMSKTASTCASRRRWSASFVVRMNAVAAETWQRAHLQLPSLHLAPVLVAHTALMLHAHPQLVHLDEIGQQEVNRVVDAARGSSIGGAAIWQQATRALQHKVWMATQGEGYEGEGVTQGDGVTVAGSGGLSLGLLHAKQPVQRIQLRN